MTTRKHTPGKWTVTTAYTDGEPSGWTVRVGQQPICDVEAVPPVTDEEAEANARLIAAAPRMLEILSFCAEVGDGRGTTLDNIADMCGDAIDQATRPSRP